MILPFHLASTRSQSEVSLLLRADVTEDELPFGVDVAVLALIPERFIRHLRQQECGFYRIEALGQVQHPVVRADAFAAHVGNKLSRAALGQNALGGLAGAAADPGHLDFGIGFLKRARFEDGFPAADVDVHLAFLLRRFDGFFPFLLPVRLSARLRQQQRYGTSRQHNSRHSHFSSQAILSALTDFPLVVS
jgi:hypothetical protein